MAKKFIVTTKKEDVEPGDLFINPETYCTINIDVKKAPAEDCTCEWDMTGDHDTWSKWECKKCGATVAAEVWD